MKKKVFIICTTILLVFLIIFFFVSKSDNKNNVNKLNNNKDVIKDQTLENLSITNVSITIDDDNVSTFSADVSNTKDTENNIETINIIFKDKDGNILTSLIGYVGKDLKKGDISKISAQTNVDLSNATYIEYKKGE